MRVISTPSIWEDYSDDALHLVCSDPATAPQTLREIWEWASFHHRDILGILAANPSTPMGILITLTGLHAAEVTRNPAFRLHMTTQPGFFLKLKRRVLQNIGRGHGVEPRLLRLLGEDRSLPPGVRSAVAGNPDCPTDLMPVFLKHAWFVRDALAGNPCLPADLLPRLAADKRPSVRCSIGRRMRLPRAIREKLAADEDPSVRATMARRRDTSTNLLGRMAAGEWVPDVLVDVIYNSRTPIEAIAPLTRHRSHRVRCAISTGCKEALTHPLADLNPATGEIVGDAELRFTPKYDPCADLTRPVPDWVLGTLIDFGWNRTPERRASLQRHGFLNMTPLRDWPPIADYLSEEEYYALLRGMIYAEADSQDEWMAGSVATTIFLAQSMVRLYPHRGDEVRAFLRDSCRNGHIWGLEKTQAERTPEERLAYIRAELARKDAHDADQRRREAEKAARAEAGAAEVRRRTHLQRALSEERAREHETLSHYAPADRLRRIIENTRVTLAYFSPEWGEVNHAVLSALRPDELTALHVRCQLKSSRSWRGVAARCCSFLQATTGAAVPKLPQDARRAPDHDTGGQA
jgi:hypothetical protein